MNSWTEEEKRIVLEHAGSKLAREIAEELTKRGYPGRTPGAVRGIWRRHTLDKLDTTQSNEVVVEMPKILYFDIETTDLSAGFGEVLMMAYRWHHEDEYHIIHIFDFEGWDELPIEKRDIYLVKHISKLIEEADALVGHYSVNFDHAFIQTRCLIHGLPPIPSPVHIDTWKIARYQLRLNNNKLVTLAKSLGCENQKSELPYTVWRRSKAHDIWALKAMSDYCVQDVRTLYDCTQKVLPLAKGMPSWNIITNEAKLRCPGCGGYQIQKQGRTYTKLNAYQRYQCQGCGKWLRGRTTLVSRDADRLTY